MDDKRDVLPGGETAVMRSAALAHGSPKMMTEAAAGGVGQIDEVFPDIKAI